jgi:hypothetical protein
MPKLDRWLVASKVVDALDSDAVREIHALGGQIGGGWYEIHTHICVNQENKEKIEHLLQSQGLRISSASDEDIQHPECARKSAEAV